ncbi:ABC transporter permease subunit/CPBP intramembrane protease [Candidatus Riflebacteria bacterium]
MKKNKLDRVLSIFKKEFLSTLRDSNTLLSMVLLPILIYPIMALAGSMVATQAKNRVDSEIVTVSIPRELKNYEDWFASDTIKIVYYKQAHEQVEKGELDAAVVFASSSIPLDSALFQSGSQKSLSVKILYDRTRWQSRKAEDHIWLCFNKFQDHIVKKRLKFHKLEKGFSKPIKFKSKNLAKPEKVGGFLIGKFIPGLILIFAMIGAFYPAIDLTAGEKERGTLETLLLSPIPLMEFMYGKFLAVLGVILITVSLNLMSMGLTAKITIEHLRQAGVQDIAFNVSPEVILIIFLSMIPFGASMASIMMTVALIARSTKEAQNYLNPLLFIVCIPAFSNSIPGFELNPLTALIPVANLALLFKTLLLGNIPWLSLTLTLVSTMLYCGFTLALAGQIFTNRDILLRESEDIAHIFLPVKTEQTSPSARASVIIFGCILFLLYSAGAFIQNSKLYPMIVGLVLIQLCINLAPPLCYLLFFRYRLIAALDLELHKIRWQNLLLLPILGICILILIVKWTHFQESFMPTPKGLAKIFSNIFSDNPLWQILLVFSLLAGFCEEVLFRGFIQKGLRTQLSPFFAIFIASLFFGLFHLTPYKLISTFFLGLWMGIVYEVTKSLWMSIYCHAFNNAFVSLLFYFGLKYQKTAIIKPDSNLDIPTNVLIITLFFFIVGMMIFLKVNAAPVSEKQNPTA